MTGDMPILKRDTTTTVSSKDQAKRASMDRAAKPKLAASILLVRGKPGAEEILVGLRSKKHDFMPDVYVFPGGRVDPGDSRVPAVDVLNPRTKAILEAAMPTSRARACVLAAIRETWEETGFIIGEPEGYSPYNGNHPSWITFSKAGLAPDLSEIHVIGRAVTPPYRPKRFDTWFFMTRLNEAQAARDYGDSDELLDTRWVSLKEAKTLKMHAITKMVVDVLSRYLVAPVQGNTVPYSRFERGKFVLEPFPKTGQDS